jgi:RecA-family ATPase
VLPAGLPSREIALLVGGDGTGKILLALLAAISVSCGLPWAGGLLPAPTTTGKVVYVSGEDDTDEAHRRIRAILGRLTADIPPGEADMRQRLSDGLRRIEIIPLDGHPMPLLVANRQDADPEESSWVGRLRERIEGARLLILDPLVMFHSVSENDNQHMDRLMRCIQRIIRSVPGCGALLVHHAGQGSVRDGADDAMVARGATALHGAARAVFAVRRLTGGEVERFQESGEDPWRWRAVRGPKISRARERPVAYVRFDDAGVPMMHDVELGAADARHQPARKAAKYGGR